MSLIRFVELASVAILLGAGVVAARRGRLGTFLKDGALVSLGGLLAELSVLHLYGFYSYAEGWSVFVDRMPLTVVLVWGYVIVSARELAGHLHGQRPFWLVAAIVLYDAALIEPVASRAGLWRWDEGGLFAVPFIGVLGWSIYAAAASATLDRPRLRLLTPLLAPLLTHVGLLACWWGGLRWVARSPSPEMLLAASALLVAALLAGMASVARPVPLGVLLPRAPAGMLFFALLPVVSPTRGFLLYVGAFALPWAVLVLRAFIASRAGDRSAVLAR